MVTGNPTWKCRLDADVNHNKASSKNKIVFLFKSNNEKAFGNPIKRRMRERKKQMAGAEYGEVELTHMAASNVEAGVFSNIMKDTQMHILADSDEQEVVQQVQVGAQIETELKEKKLSVEDALNATKVAVEEGIVVGGGCTLLRVAAKVDAIRDALDNEEQKLYAVVSLYAGGRTTGKARVCLDWRCSKQHEDQGCGSSRGRKYSVGLEVLFWHLSALSKE
ncbi:hypothetical protein IFM89_027209 [Coptis chinensis]|uniref:RuBisCO large subunit-binding protein subunit beta, chloroplastic n=1 Tax=Coptis chinensis TaxID=261450 RepID=A0A835IYM2_9MAGN|nr:hypothetical protein IFM89_027209 [Coptis chinensis]